MKETEFQIYQCENPECRFRCPTDLTLQVMERCPACGGPFTAQGKPFSNYRQVSIPDPGPRFIFEVALDNLRSTLNVGSIFRTADGAGVSHVYCCGTTPTPKHPKIEKSGLGAEGFIPWTYCRNTLDLVQGQKQAGFRIVCLEATGSSSSIFSWQAVNVEKLLLVMGNEVSGIDPAILAAADEVLAIPMVGKKTSLNVAVAFGIAAYTLLNQ
jgi:tRNA G18 (ribose-2'-O)-methylase SpoU